MNVVVLAILISSGPVQAAPPPRGTLRAAAATVDITPPPGAPMWGYGGRRDAPSLGVLDPLRARALVLEVDGRRIALVSLDLGRPPTRQSTAAVRDRVRKEAGVDELFLVASHTHHGPVLEVDTWPTPATSYVRGLERKLGDLIVTAARGLQPARLGVASRQVAFNRNRNARGSDRPVDQELLVLRVEDLLGTPIAHAVNFAAHPTNVPPGLRKWSADYPGALTGLVEAKTKAPCLFLQGAGGDLSVDRQSGESGEEFGRRLGRTVLALAGSIQCKELANASLRTRQEAFNFRSRIDVGNPLVWGAMSLVFYPDLVTFYEKEYRQGVRPQLTLALLDERIGFVGVSGEFFAGHALSLKRRARLEHLFFLGYCNDYQQYFPTIEAASAGGYGTEPYISPAATGAGERMMDRALIHLYQMRGKLLGPATP